MAAEVRAFQIFYDEKTRAMLDPDFEPLDNTKNERPDWYEYWPIRSYLEKSRLDDSAYYGFFSTSFHGKTRLTGRQVKDFVAQAGDADVVTFSPWPCYGACFFNVFEQGDFSHAGLFDVATRFFSRIDARVDPKTLITDSRNTVFSNYFLARPKFWRTWKEVLDLLFEAAESPASPLYAALNERAHYRKLWGENPPADMKVFLMERAPSFLLAASDTFKVKNYPPFEMPCSPLFADHVADIIVMDALKISYSKTSDPFFLQLFREVRDKALDAWLALSQKTGAS